MPFYKWYLPTLSEILALEAPPEPSQLQSPAQQRVRAEREWRGAVAAVNQMLEQMALTEADGASELRGLLLSGPVPVLAQPERLPKIAAWTFTVGSAGEIPLQLLPAATHDTLIADASLPTLPLLPDDPLATEQFCLVLTARFCLVMALGETADQQSVFLFSFEPEVVWQVWRALQARLKLTSAHVLPTLEGLIEQFAAAAPDYRTVTQFSRLMLAHLPEPSEWDSDWGGGVRERVVLGPPAAAAVGSETFLEVRPRRRAAARSLHKPVAEPELPRAVGCKAEPAPDTELLQAIAHEVRTPLTTIRTLTRLLLRRKDLSPDVTKRLEVIDRECTEQIDRFNLIFRAVELETAENRSLGTPLAAISLTQVLQQNIPRWQQQATQHSHTLDVVLPQKMPTVVTDPVMLDQALTGLIDRITHSLPPGSHIRLQVTPAGHQLKLQFESQIQPTEDGHCGADGKSKFGFTPVLKSIGQLLMFQPETGNLSLNMAVTKNLFQALGGKLIVRQRPQQGEVLTIFLPLETRKVED